MAKPTYEEMRQKRLEENKKRMESLNLTQLAQTLKNASPKPSPMKKQGTPRIVRLQVDLAFVRRSTRVANMPPPVYKEEAVVRLEKPRFARIYTHQRKDLLNRVYASDDAREYATQKAEELQSSLDPNIPSFVKPMTQSHVTGGFWLGLPTQFCRKNLPKRDERIILEDENEEEYETLLLAQKRGLSAGWRGFAMAHDLVDGDALVFQLVKPTKFKIYIIRVNSPGEADQSPDVIN